MTSKAISGAASAVLPYIALAGGAVLLLKSGILGKLWSDLTGTIEKKADEIYSSVYNNRTIETIRNVTNVQNIVETVEEAVLGEKTYVPPVIADADGNVIDSTKRIVITTEGRTLIPAQIPGLSKDLMMTVLGPAMTDAELKAVNAGVTVLVPGHFERNKAWWQKNVYDVAGDVWGFLTGNQKTEHVSAPSLSSQSTGISVIIPSQNNGDSSMAQIEKTISKNPAVDPAVAERVSRDEERNRQARSDNARRLAEAEANPPTLEQILNDPSVWPTPSQSTKPNYGF